MEYCLDVGCGYAPKGTVNIDVLEREKYPFKEGYRYDSIEELKRIQNFIVADACFLPFRDKCFLKSVCFHVLEHIADDSLALVELKRVTVGEIEVRVPFAWFETIFNSVFFWLHLKEWRKKYHFHEYTKGSLRKSLFRVFDMKMIKLSYGYISFIHGLSFKAIRKSKFPLPFPYEIIAKIYLVGY